MLEFYMVFHTSKANKKDQNNLAEVRLIREKYLTNLNFVLVLNTFKAMMPTPRKTL